METIYDLAIIGGGPGGYVAAQRAAEGGMKVVLFERNSLGGVCLNEGCIPTKSLLFSAKQYTHAREAGAFGVHAENVGFDFGGIMARKDKVVKKLVAAIKSSMKHHGVEVVAENARIDGRADDGSFRVCTASGDCRLAARLLICTGSEAVVPPVPGLGRDNPAVVTSTGILRLESLPESLTVIGGGVIGMEFAAFFNALGCKVCVIEMLGKILGPMDEEISGTLRRTYEKRGIEFLLGCRVTGAEGGKVSFEGGEPLCSEMAILAIGVSPDSGLAREAGLELGARGAIAVDEHMRTSVEGVYAAGDVTGRSLLAHSASREGEVAVNDMLGKDDRMSYAAVPSVVYTSPEVASVGMTFARAVGEGLEAEVRKLPLTYSGRFVAETERENGLCKIVSEKGTGRLLGMQMIGGPCSEIIPVAAAAIEAGMDVGQLQKVIFPHPSVSEIIKETAFSEAVQEQTNP